LVYSVTAIAIAGIAYYAFLNADDSDPSAYDCGGDNSLDNGNADLSETSIINNI